MVSSSGARLIVGMKYPVDPFFGLSKSLFRVVYGCVARVSAVSSVIVFIHTFFHSIPFFTLSLHAFDDLYRVFKLMFRVHLE